MADKKTEQIVIGSLMKQPQLLSMADRYSLTVKDFDDRLMSFIFYAIAHIAAEGSTKIEVQDVDLFLQNSETGKELFKSRDGISLLNDSMELANTDSFGTYYSLLKKENLLRDLKNLGIDVSEYYQVNPITGEALQLNDRFMAMDIEEIIGSIKARVADLEGQYAKGTASSTQSVVEGMRDLIDDLEENPEVGPPLQGEIFNTVVSGARRGTFYVRSGASGVSKALPNSTRIPTPSGWTTVGKVRVGDHLFDAFGKPTKVIGVFPQGEKEVFEVTFKDGRKAKCCKEHLWSFNTSSQKQKSKDNRVFYTESLADIMKRPLQNSRQGYNILVPMNKAVEYEEKDFYLPPYVFGLLLGDGSFRQHKSNKSLQFSSETPELPNLIAEEMGWTVKRGSKHNFTWFFGFKEAQESQPRRLNVWVEEALREYPELIGAYSNTKFIPDKYLQGSISQRIDLLNGLLDSDGTIDEKGRVSFATTSERMRDNIIELVQSLGMKGSFGVSTTGRDRPLFTVNIVGSKEQKQLLFRLQRKVDIRDRYIKSGKRVERNTHNPIIKIESLGYSEEMTCFRVDNDEHLFLMNDYIVTHNTRSSIADACYLAFPVRYNPSRRTWENTGACEKVLVVITEQSFREVRTMILAYLTGFNEKKIKRKSLMTTAEEEILEYAVQVVEAYQENMYIVQMPAPDIQTIKAIVRANVLKYGINYVFYDYIFISPSLLAEFKGFNLRNDEVLLMLSTALKDLAVELDVFVLTSTQVNASADDNREIRNEGSIAGSRAIINKADIGCVMARPSTEELKTLQPVIQNCGLEPNLVTDIYKNRGDQWTQVRIWSQFDMGNLRKRDLFITNSRLEAVEDFVIDRYLYNDETSGAIDLINRLNRVGKGR